ncbi:MAG: HAMP domain-containing protein, partial [Desulfobulbaceae bacterium]|nr:HAMP domain-containing protein [Desulfobulbaceae bacterium]
VIEAKVDSILALVRDYSGLGQTGETLVVKRNEAGEPVFLLPTRFGRDEAVGQTLAKDKMYAANYAFAGEKVLLDCIDYREQPVLAIGRHVETAGWGVVVKIDKAEAYAPVDSLRRVLLLMLVAAVVLVFVVAMYVAAGISAPIDSLASVAKRIADGELGQKADVTSGDEVGELARSFNKMVDALMQTSADLTKKVEELRGEVSAHEQSEHDKELLIEKLQKALAEIKTLKGIVPICASCKKIRDDQGYWNQIEAYVREHSEAEFSHGLCPDCARTLYPGINFPDNLR